MYKQVFLKRLSKWLRHRLQRFSIITLRISASFAPLRLIQNPKPQIRNPKFLILSLSLGLSLSLSAQQPDLGTEAQREAGRKIYLEKCAQCHGETGDGNGVAKRFFRPQPRDFTAGIFKFRSTPSGDLPTDEDLKRSIRDGMAYTGMPGWPRLSEKDITNLMYYLKTFNDYFSGPYGVVEPIAIPKPPSFSEESAERGRQVYIDNQCFDCHGNQGRGDGKSAPTLKDHWGEPIRAADLTKRWTFRNGKTRQDIYRTFTTGLDGSPMPSYAIEPENQWALVDYVYSLSRDEPNYAAMVIAHAVEYDIDLSRGRELFPPGEGALFPVVGQVIEPGREFYPGVNAVEVKAIYNANEIAILVSWHDMSAETSGMNSPAIPAPLSDPDSVNQSETVEKQYSDAVAIQLPAKMPEGQKKPYFLFGDRSNPVDIWFMNLAEDQPEFFVGKGSENIETGQADISAVANYDEGEWAVIFKRSRISEEGLPFEEGQFVPVAFSVWDGFNGEQGNKRGITSWYYLYVEPMETESAAIPMLKYGITALLIELLLVSYVRRKYGKAEAFAAIEE